MITEKDKYYFNVPGLLVPKMIQHQQIHSHIGEFIDTIPSLTEQIEVYVLNISKHRSNFFKVFDQVILLLKNIYAQSLEAEATRIIFCAQDDPKSKALIASVKTLITNMLSLSITLQKAQYQEVENEPTKSKETENQVAIADILSTINNFIDEKKFDNVNALLSALSDHFPNDFTIIKVLEAIAVKDYNEAKNVISNFISKKNELINQSIKTNLSKMILAVDDRPEMLSFVSNALKSHFKIFCVPSGDTAIKLLAMHKPDLFILDIDMPEMNGYELAEIIRNMDNFKLTPIIFLTGNSTRDHIAKAIKVGGNDFIVKPTTHETLLLKVGRFL